MNRRNANSVPRAWRWLWIAAVALALSLAGCGGDAEREARPAETVAGLRVETVAAHTVPDEIEAPGTVRSVATAEVAARVMAPVVAVPVREGDAVRRGQLLVQLDERELASRRNAAQAALREAVAAREEAARAVAAAEAQAEVARKTYDRFVYLQEQYSVSPQEFDEVEARHRAAAAALGQARARQQQVEAMYERAESEARAAETVAGYARLVAPFDGVVVRRHAEPGMMAVPGASLVVVESTSRYRLEVTVEATGAAALRRGRQARIVLDALPGRELEGTVTEVEAGADAASHTIKVKVELPRDPAIRSGLFGRAWFVRGERQALTVPATAVVTRGQLQGIYMVDPEGIARLRLVTLRALPGDEVEILSGLSAGERIVADPGGRELDGKKVGDGR